MSAPRDRLPGGSGRPSRSFQRSARRLFGRNVIPRRSVAENRLAVRYTEPDGTVGVPAIHDPALEGNCFQRWARHARRALTSDLICSVAEDLRWDVWRVTQVLRGEKRARSSLVRVCDGTYQIPADVRSDRFFVRTNLEGIFVSMMDSFLRSPIGSVSGNPIRDFIKLWGSRLPSYSPEGSANRTRSREWDSFESAFWVEGRVVVTRDDWEVLGGMSVSTKAFKEASIGTILDRGFHVAPHKVFPATPNTLLGPGCIPAGLAIPPLWTMRFFSCYAGRTGAPDGSCHPSALVTRRFLEVLSEELVLCVALGVTAEREAFHRTPIVSIDLINKLLECGDEFVIPTSVGSVNVCEVGVRLREARKVAAERWVPETPLHVSRPIYYVPDHFVEESFRASASTAPPTIVSAARSLGIRSVPLRSGDDAVSEERVVAPSEPRGSDVLREVVRCRPLQELSGFRVDLRELVGAYPHMKVALAPLLTKQKSSMGEVLECFSGWVRQTGSHSPLAMRRGSRGGTAKELKRTRADLTAARRDNNQLRGDLSEMTNRVAGLSKQLGAQARGSSGKRSREDYEDGWRSEGSYEDGRAARFRRDWSPREESNKCRDTQPWRRDGAGGNDGGGFAA